MASELGVPELEGWVRAFAAAVAEHRDELTALDSAIGDADHGANMDRGMSAVVAALDGGPPADAAALFKLVGATLVSKVGGASGPLYGTFFLRVAGAGGAGPWDAGTVAKALRAGVEGVVARGKAEPGDKTMLDALLPACDALEAALAAGQPLADAVGAAATAAVEGRDATKQLQARKGRASYLGERSIGHVDPGATSAALLVEAAATALVPAQG
ncbi:dihydroxyacetone kinase subunit DhaL [Modestobacter sp. I12A-02662]|uniref:dihydroxyacetone kinase subunit DhaL n=1 Tax=Modestobacter sp. I12A-02662 TaxID=1730496 RepID=UPI0034DFCDFE